MRHIYICDYCGAEFDDEDELFRHVRGFSGVIDESNENYRKR